MARRIFFATTLSLIMAACNGGSQSPNPETPVDETPPEGQPPEGTPPGEGPVGEGPAPAPAPSPAPEPEPPPIKVGQLKLTVTNKGKTTPIELTSEGVVKRGGKDVLKFSKNEVLDNDGKWVLRVKRDGTVEARWMDRVMKGGKVESESEKTETIGKIASDDSFEHPEKGKVTFDEKGVLNATKPDGKPEKIQGVNAVGFTPDTRRAAALLVIALWSPANSIFEPPKPKPPEPKAPPTPKTPAPGPGGTPPGQPKTPTPAPAPKGGSMAPAPAPKK